MAGGAFPGLVVLGSIRKHVEQAMGSKPGNSYNSSVWRIG